MLPLIQVNLPQTPTISVLELLGGPVGMTTMLSEITSMVKVPAGLTSDITLPGVSLPSIDVMTLLGGPLGMTTMLPEVTAPELDLPGADVMTLLGEVDGLTTELPALETGGLDLGLPALEPPDVNLPDPVFITDIIGPPEATDPPNPPADVSGAARPSVGLAAGVAGLGVLGFIAVVL